MKRAIILAASAAALLVVCACAAGSTESAHAAAGGDVSQFFLGVWHGLIAPVMLIIEVVDKLAPKVLPWSVRFYESRGTGVVYDVGFYLGLAGSPVVLFSGWSRRR